MFFLCEIFVKNENTDFYTDIFNEYNLYWDPAIKQYNYEGLRVVQP